MEKVVRHMKLIGEDDWGRPVYKAQENGVLWKDINCGKGKLNLNSCDNDFYGEPDCPISQNIEVIIVK